MNDDLLVNAAQTDTSISDIDIPGIEGREVVLEDGDTATNITIRTGGRLLAYSGSRTSNITVYGGTFDLAGGTATGYTKIAGGQLKVAYTASSVLDGQLEIGKGQMVNLSTLTTTSNSTITFNVSERPPDSNTPLITDISRIIGGASYSITVATDQEDGVYRLANGGTYFNQFIYINIPGMDTGALSLSNYQGDGYSYRDTLNNKQYSIERDAQGAIYLRVASGSDIVGKNYNGIIIGTGGNNATLYLYDGDTAQNILVNSSSIQYVQGIFRVQGGYAENTTVNAYGYLEQSGGVTNYTTVVGGIAGQGEMVISGSAVANHLTIGSKGLVTLYGNAEVNGVTILESGKLQAQNGNQKITNLTLTDHADFNLYASQIISGTNYDGTAFSQESGVLSGFKYRRGVLHVASSEITNTVIESLGYGASLLVESGGISRNTVLSAYYASGTAGQYYANEILNGGTSYGTQVGAYAAQTINSGTAYDTLVLANGIQIVNGSSAKAKDTVVQAGGTLEVSEGGTLDSASIANGALLHFTGKGTVQGTFHVEGKVVTDSSATVTIADSTEIIFILNSAQVNTNEALINNFKNWQGSNYTLTINAGSAPLGTYKLLEGINGSFTKSITVKTVSSDSLILSPGGGISTEGTRGYELIQTGDSLYLNISVSALDANSNNNDPLTAPELFSAGSKTFTGVEWIGTHETLGYDAYDYYRFSAGPLESFSFNFSYYSYPFYVSIYSVDANNHYILVSSVLIDGVTSSVTSVLSEGNYVLEIASYYGYGTEYTMDAERLLLDDVHNNNPDTTEAELTFSGGSASRQDQIIGYGDAVDAFKFTVEDGKYGKYTFSVNASGSMGIVYLAVYTMGYMGQYGYVAPQLVAITVANGSAEMKLENLLLGAGEYTVRVFIPDAYAGYDGYSYSLDATEQLAPCDQNGGNNSPVTAVSLFFSGSGVITTASVENEFVGYGDAVDYYRINVSSGQKYLFDFTFDIDLLTAPIYVEIYASGNLAGEGTRIAGKWIYAAEGYNTFNNLILSGNTANYYFLKVYASNPADNLGNTEYSFTVQRSDMEGNNPNDANNQLLSGLDIWSSGSIASVNGWVGYGDAFDSYKVTVASGAINNLTVRLSGLQSAVWIFVYESSGAFLYNQMITQNGEFNLTLAAGDYTVVVYAGDTLGANPDYNTSYSLYMSKTSVDKDVPGTSNNSINLTWSGNTAKVSGAWIGKGDELDRYRFSVAAGQLASFDLNFAFTELNRGLLLYVYRVTSDPLGNPIYTFVTSSAIYSNPGYNNFNSLLLGEGDYIFDVHALDYYGNSNLYNTSYDLTVTRNIMDNVENNTFAAAVTITAMQNVSGQTGYGDPVDVYKFTVAGNTFSSLNLLNLNVQGTGIYLYLYDQNYNIVKAQYIAGNMVNKQFETGLLGSGDYYLVVYSADMNGLYPQNNTTYSFTVNSPVTGNTDFAQNNDYASAVSLQWTSVPGKSLNYTCTVSDYIGYSDPVDYYRFSVTAKDSFDFTFTSLDAGLYLYIYQIVNNQLYYVTHAYIGSAGGQNSLKNIVLGEGSYVAAVYSSDWSATNTYNTQYDLTVNKTTVDKEGNDNILTTTSLLMHGNTVKGMVGYGDAVDFHKFNSMIDYSAFTFSITNHSSEVSIFVIVYDSAGYYALTGLLEIKAGETISIQNRYLTGDYKLAVYAGDLAGSLPYYNAEYSIQTTVNTTNPSADPTGAENNSMSGRELVWSNNTISTGKDWIGMGDSYDRYSFTIDEFSAVLSFKFTDNTAPLYLTVMKDNIEIGTWYIAANGAAGIALSQGNYTAIIHSVNPYVPTYNTQYSMTVEKTVADEVNNNTLALAAGINLSAGSASVSDFVGYGDAVDYYKLELASGKDYTFKVTVGSALNPVYLIVYNQYGIAVSGIIVCNPGMDTEFNIRATESVQYYIGLYAADWQGRSFDYNAAYTLDISTTAATSNYDPSNAQGRDNNSRTGAPLLQTSNTELYRAWEINFSGAPQDIAEVEWLSAGDLSDRYSFTATGEKSLFNFNFSNMTNTAIMTLYKVVNGTLQYYTSAYIFNSTIGNLFLAAGDYVIEVSAYLSETAYDMTVTQTVADQSSNDNFYATTNLLPAENAAAKGWVGYGDAVDFYNLTVTAGSGEYTRYSIRFTHDMGDAPIHVFLYDIYTNVIFSYTISAGGQKDITLDLAGGEYRLAVYAADYAGSHPYYNAEYTIETLSVAISDMDQNSANNSPLIAPPLTDAVEWIGKGDARDCFAFTVANAADILSFTFTEMTDGIPILAYIYRLDGTTLTLLTSSVIINNYSWNDILLTQGNYILEIRPYDYYGASNLWNTNYKIESASVTMDTVFNNDPFTTQSALTYDDSTKKWSYSDTVGYGDAFDIVAFTVDRISSCTLSVAVTKNSVYFYLYQNVNGTLYYISQGSPDYLYTLRLGKGDYLLYVYASDFAGASHSVDADYTVTLEKNALAADKRDAYLAPGLEFISNSVTVSGKLGDVVQNADGSTQIRGYECYTFTVNELDSYQFSLTGAATPLYLEFYQNIAGTLHYVGGQYISSGGGQFEFLFGKGDYVVYLYSTDFGASAHYQTDYSLQIDRFVYDETQNNTLATDDVLEIGVLKKGIVGIKDPLDCYSFTLDEAKELSFTITTDQNLHFELYSIRNGIYSLEYSGTITGFNSMFSGIYGQGDYLLIVTPASPYTEIINYEIASDASTFAADGMDNNNYMTAPLLTDGIVVTDWIGFGDAVDYYRIQVDYANVYDILFTNFSHSFAGVYLHIYQEIDSVLYYLGGAYLDRATPLWNNILLTSGNYVIGIYSADASAANQYNTSYTFNVSEKRMDASDNNSIGNGTKLTFALTDNLLTAQVSEYIGYGDPLDSFELTVDGNFHSEVTLTVSGTTQTVHIYVYNQYGTVEYSATIQAGELLSKSLSLGTGNYSVVIWAADYAGASPAYTTPYSLLVTRKDELNDSPLNTPSGKSDNNSFENAFSLSWLDSGTAFTETATVTDWIGMGDPGDYYRFTVENLDKLSISLGINAVQGIYIAIYQYSPSGAMVYVGEFPVYSGQTYSDIYLAKGDYALLVLPLDGGASNQYNTSYTIDVSRTVMDETANNDYYTTEAVLSKNVSVKALIGGGDTVDYYKFDIAAFSTAVFSLTGLRGKNASVAIWDPNGNLLYHGAVDSSAPIFSFSGTSSTGGSCTVAVFSSDTVSEYEIKYMEVPGSGNNVKSASLFDTSEFAEPSAAGSSLLWEDDSLDYDDTVFSQELVWDNGTEVNLLGSCSDAGYNDLTSFADGNKDLFSNGAVSDIFDDPEKKSGTGGMLA